MSNYRVINKIMKNWIEDLETTESFEEYFCNRYIHSFSWRVEGNSRTLHFTNFLHLSTMLPKEVNEITILEWLNLAGDTSELPVQVRTEEETRKIRL